MSGIVVEQTIGMMIAVVKSEKIEIEVLVKNVIDPGQDIGVVSRNARNRSQSRDHSRDRSSSRTRVMRSRTSSRDRSTSRSRSNSCISTNRDRIRCFRCNEFDHYSRDCPNESTDDESQSESEAEDLDSTSWQMLA